MTEMALWVRLDLETKIRTVLSDASVPQPNHHFGRPYLTTYQLAIALLNRYPQLQDEIGMPIGGEGAGDSSWSQYIARNLSAEIKAGRITDIQGAFLSGENLSELRFWESAGKEFSASAASAGWGPSLYRLV